METLRDRNGNPVLSIRDNGAGQKSVYDSRGSYVGNSGSNGTFDNRGARVSPQDAPGLLGSIFRK